MIINFLSIPDLYIMTILCDKQEKKKKDRGCYNRLWDAS